MGFSSVSSTVAIPRKRFNGIPTVLRSSIEPAIEPLRSAEFVEMPGAVIIEPVEMTGAGVSTNSTTALDATAAASTKSSIAAVLSGFDRLNHRKGQRSQSS